jgi:hypothetical protein
LDVALLSLLGAMAIWRRRRIRGTVSGSQSGSYSGVFNATAVPLPAALPLLRVRPALR